MEQFRSVVLNSNAPFQKHKYNSPLPGTIKRVRSLNVYVEQCGPLDEQDPFREYVQEERPPKVWEDRDPFLEPAVSSPQTRRGGRIARNTNKADPPVTPLFSPDGQTSVPPAVDLLPIKQETSKKDEDTKHKSKDQYAPPELSPPPKPSAKFLKLETLLAQPTVELGELKRLCWSGIPLEFRCLAWKLLLGYLPASSDRREATLLRKRQDYQQSVKQYFEHMAEQECNAYEISNLEQIRKDLARPNPNVPILLNPVVRECIERILYMWAIKHPATGYVQGIDDLTSPFFVVFLGAAAGIEDAEKCDVRDIPKEILDTVEADCYGCLSALLDGIQDHYTFAQPGIQRMIFKFKELIHRIDAPLYNHLMDCDPQFILQFSFRWMNCFLMREFTCLSLIIRMWDTYFAEGDGFAVFHTYVCTALLLQWANQLKLLDAEKLMIFLQHMPTQEWTESDIELLLSHAYQLKAFYHNSQAHLL